MHPPDASNDGVDIDLAMQQQARHEEPYDEESDADNSFLERQHRDAVLWRRRWILVSALVVSCIAMLALILSVMAYERSGSGSDSAAVDGDLTGPGADNTTLPT